MNAGSTACDLGHTCDLGHRTVQGRRASFDVAVHLLAVRTQHVEFVLEIRPGEQVAGLGILRDEAQRLSFARATDENRRVRSRQVRW
jgi:hypothetical protein